MLSKSKRHDPFWEMDGEAAKGARRRNRIVATAAFAVAIAAATGAATMWWVEVGVSALVHARLGIL